MIIRDRWFKLTFFTAFIFQLVNSILCLVFFLSDHSSKSFVIPNMSTSLCTLMSIIPAAIYKEKTDIGLSKKECVNKFLTLIFLGIFLNLVLWAFVIITPSDPSANQIPTKEIYTYIKADYENTSGDENIKDSTYKKAVQLVHRDDLVVSPLTKRSKEDVQKRIHALSMVFKNIIICLIVSVMYTIAYYIYFYVFDGYDGTEFLKFILCSTFFPILIFSIAFFGWPSYLFMSSYMVGIIYGGVTIFSIISLLGKVLDKPKKHYTKTNNFLFNTNTNLD